MGGHLIRRCSILSVALLGAAWAAPCAIAEENASNTNALQASGNGNTDDLDKPATDASVHKENHAAENNAKENHTGARNTKAQPEKTPESDPTSDADEGGARDTGAKSISVRRFHEVLNELLTEFGFDVKTGQLGGLKNIAIRKVSVNSNLPRSYGEYVETLVQERIRENSRVKIIKCIPCSTKRSILSDGKLVITSPLTNMEEMIRAADQLGIDHFMDVMLVYHTSHMVLAFNIFSVSTKELIWARSYNSETLKTRYQKLAVDYSQIAKSRPGDEYVPSYRYMIGLGAASIPNVSGSSNDRTMIDFDVRATEKFNNRKSEFGLNLSILKTTTSFLSNYPTQSQSGADSSAAATPASGSSGLKPFTTALMLHAIFAHNFFGEVESYDEIRHGMNMGLGLLAASGYFAGSARLGWDTFFGKRFSVSFGAIYIAGAEVLVDKKLQKVKGGGGGDCIFSYNF